MSTLRLVAPLLIALATVGCGADGGYFQSITSGAGAGSTLVLVWLSDSPADAATNLWVTLESVDWVGATQTTRLLTGPRPIDLLTLRNGVREGLGQGSVPVEAAQSLRLTLAPEGGGRHRVRVGGIDHELLFDGPGDAVLDLPVSVTLVKAASVEVQVDLNARLSIVAASATWWLRPRGLALDTARAGFLAGSVADAGAVPLVGAVLSAQQAGEEVASTRSGSGGSFRLGPLPPGAYRLVASNDGHAPSGLSPVLVGAGVPVQPLPPRHATHLRKSRPVAVPTRPARPEGCGGPPRRTPCSLSTSGRRGGPSAPSRRAARAQGAGTR